MGRARRGGVSAVALVLVLMMGVQPARAGDARADALAAEIHSETPGLMQRYGVPGVAVAIVAPDGGVQVLNFGVADAVTRRPVDDDTVFLVGSISKFVTAVGVLRMVEKGTLAFDAPVSAYLRRWSFPKGDFDPAGVTIRRLLSHSAGVSVSGYFPGVVYPGEVPSILDSLTGVTSPGEAVRLVAPPGGAYAYSGGGYSVLQIAVEDATGVRFAQAMRREVFDPLGLTRSSFAIDAQAAAGRARPHDPGGRAMPLRVLPNAAAAGLSTTAGELAKVVRAALRSEGSAPALLTPTGAALLATQMAPPEALLARPGMTQVMLAPETYPDPSAVRYGPGAAVTMRADGRRIVGHSGSNAGWKANVQYSPQAGYGIVVLTNGESGNGVIMPLVCRWRRMLDGPTAGVCPEHAAAFVGTVYARQGVAAAEAALRRTAAAPDRWFVTDRSAEDVIGTMEDLAGLDGRDVARDAERLARVNATLFPASAYALASLAKAEAGVGKAGRARTALDAALALNAPDEETRKFVAAVGRRVSALAHSKAPQQ